jgi:hypothetical protein
MSVGRVRPPRRRWISVFAVAVATYALILAAGELQHHDLACHLKSRTHCTWCVSGVSHPGVAPAGQPAAADLRLAGEIETRPRRFAVSPALIGSPGRSPPPA